MRVKWLIPAALLLFGGLGQTAWSAGENSRLRVEIDNIEFFGVEALQKTEIEALLEVAPGEQFEQVRVARDAQSLRDLYKKKGYEKVAIRTELIRRKTSSKKSETILKYFVEEGSPVRIAKIGFGLKNPLPPTATRENAFWTKIQNTLSQKIPLKTGDVFDQDKITSARRTIEDALASEEYFGARVEEVETKGSSAPQSKDEKFGPSLRWVDLNFAVTLGDRVTFGFSDNTVFTRSQLNSFIEDIRLIGFGRDFVNAIKTRIEDEYKAVGYSNVQVTIFTFEKVALGERHVSFRIHEGPKVMIESLEFEGNRVFSKEQLTQLFFSTAPLLIQKRVYIDKEIGKAGDLLIESLKSQGYLSAKLVSVNRFFSAKKDTARLVFYVLEGEQTIVEKIIIEGVRYYPIDEAKRILRIQEETPFNHYAFEEGIESLKAAYRNKGYLEFHLTNESPESIVRYSDENRRAEIRLSFSEGPQFHVTEIEVDGLTKTHKPVVTRELRFKVGDVLEEHLIDESEGRLRKLGIFSTVSIRIFEDANDPQGKKVRVAVQEAFPGLWGGGLGYRNDLGPRVFGQLSYGNLFEENHTVFLNTNAYQRTDKVFCSGTQGAAEEVESNCSLEYQAEIGYNWPWVFLGETTFRPNFSVARTQYKTFSAYTIGFSATLEKKLLTKPNLIGTFSYSLERIRQFNARFGVDNVDLRIGAFIPSLRLDLRDNPLAPTSGYFASVSYELAAPEFFSDPTVGYSRVETRQDLLVPIGKGMTWYISARTGWERNNIRGSGGILGTIPLIKQFALGGASSLRGFKEQELSIANTAVSGSASYVNYRTQLDLPFAGALRFGPFLDAANLLVDDFSFVKDLRFGLGVGFHYQTPIGPINFDWGFKFRPRADESPQEFYFSVGML
ncbi:BamA/TamA family outer membrane protein [bacterium]|nr:BamA/TamA family outer membrane protein [bacterium]